METMTPSNLALALAEDPTPRYGHLTDYNSGEVIRPATEAERYSSIEAADIDGGAGVIEVDGIKCFVA